MPLQLANLAFGKLIFSKFTAVLLITSLGMPLFLIYGLDNANAKTSRKVRQEPVVKHAPPEPFIIGSDLATNRFRVPITSA
ncbi:MAG: hypothetical protein ACRD6X_13590, partial [Pyrinomonadaceae bacterium]